ncbi:MAG: hypothetical protein Q9195_003988 [Heterodermia aff. obscurata]
MTVYRIVFHPLRSFKGPFLNRISKLWHLFHAVWRHGPSELTIFHPEVFNAIAGPGTQCKKSDWYDMLYPLVALNSIREKTGYVSRRSKWDQALKATAMHDEEIKVVRYATQLAQALRAAEEAAVDVTDWFSFFSFDVMGDLAFAKSFDTLATGYWHNSVKLVRNGTDLLGVASSWLQMIAWCKSTMNERLKLKVDKPDASYWLIEAARQDTANGLSLDMDNLYGDAIAIIIAGSIATTLMYLFLNLAENPDIQSKLRADLLAHGWRSDVSLLKCIPFLDAVIDETLRLYPAVPTGGSRMTGASGATIAGHYIPPETTIVAPRYTIGRRQKSFQAL